MKKIWMVAVAVVTGVLVGVGAAAVYHGARASDPKAALAALPASEWPVLTPSLQTPVGGATGAADTTTQVAPVESLLAGLEARLAAQPNDAKGWVLLAQSYAFVGNGAAAESAVQRAVALGFDERELRDRVDFARRESASGDWIEQMIGVKRR